MSDIIIQKQETETTLAILRGGLIRMGEPRSGHHGHKGGRGGKGNPCIKILEINQT